MIDIDSQVVIIIEKCLIMVTLYPCFVATRMCLFAQIFRQPYQVLYYFSRLQTIYVPILVASTCISICVTLCPLKRVNVSFDYK
jgi:hypothetical protein